MRKTKIVEPQPFVHCDIDHCTASAAMLGQHPLEWSVITSERSLVELDLCPMHSAGWVPLFKHRLSNEFDIVRNDAIKAIRQGTSGVRVRELIERLEAL